MPRHYRYLVGEALAAAFLSADAWDPSALVTSGALALGARPAWLRRVARTVIRVFPEPPRDRIHTLARYVARDSRVAAACTSGEAPRVRRILDAPPAMGTSPWPIPPLATLGELGGWLGLAPTAPEWIADARGLDRLVRDEALRHYVYRWVPKPN